MPGPARAGLRQGVGRVGLGGRRPERREKHRRRKEKELQTLPETALLISRYDCDGHSEVTGEETDSVRGRNAEGFLPSLFLDLRGNVAVA